MLIDRFSCRLLWKLIPALSLVGCGNIVLQTTSEPEENTSLLNSDAGVVSDTFFVSGSTLFDPCGKPVVLRGVNEMVTFVPDGKDGNPYFDDIANTGANSIRIYWRTTDTKDELDQLLSNAETHKLIPIIYVFNYPSPSTPSSSTTVMQAADFWTRSDIVPIVLKHQQWLIIALRERDLLTTETTDQWASNFDAAVQQIRQASINVPLAIDAPAIGTTYGADIDTLTATGATRISDDPQHNLLLSTNAWWQNYTSDTITSKITAAASLPLLIGEFSVNAQPPYSPCGNLFDYAALLQVAQDTGTGWEAWSWGAVTNQNCASLDMTNGGSSSSYSAWGQDVAISNVKSIHNTSVPARFTPGKGCQ